MDKAAAMINAVSLVPWNLDKVNAATLQLESREFLSTQSSMDNRARLLLHPNGLFSEKKL